MSARLTRSKEKQRTEMPDTEAKLVDTVLAKMDDLLAVKDEQESKVKRKPLKMSAN